MATVRNPEVNRHYPKTQLPANSRLGNHKYHNSAPNFGPVVTLDVSRNSTTFPTIFLNVLQGLPSSLEAKVKLLTRLRHDRFLLNPFQFITHYPSQHSTPQGRWVASVTRLLACRERSSHHEEKDFASSAKRFCIRFKSVLWLKLLYCTVNVSDG
jgi:hypothetical protein